ncbi:TetR/AcrR family transcriptional regulator [Conexibacter woesei]|uniref:Transcriptional regulator, TetR family n=1 Tax=Conexibacter woesei (strain DSM 14684 / CCUG 47730 / CIP 108061 / JCM 11494 / NBRC 100937 / ID131577) TaxID=469383 RepID=D3FFH7_CONWI|nr:TetR/AcrR family transcriptional regulator [Conexibacter woesei]ADB53770.1 transcriptional regulator, TetR family [Conexibacter woesei DSM 14684]
MREWIPVSTSPKGRLALAAVTAFGARPFDAVTVGELAQAASVTTGALYHHFGSKLGLYAFVREDVERRLLDRMEGAISATGDAADRTAGVRTALVVGFDFAVREGFLHILGAPPAGARRDRLADVLSTHTDPVSPLLGLVLAAAWRAALIAVADGSEPQLARAALLALDVAVPEAP